MRDEIEVHWQDPRHRFEDPVLLVSTRAREWYFRIAGGVAVATCVYDFREDGKFAISPGPDDPVPQYVVDALEAYNGPYGTIDRVLNPPRENYELSVLTHAHKAVNADA